MQNFTKIFLFLLFSSVAIIAAACSGAATGSGSDPNETAATVNGKAIKLEEVERAIKQQTNGEESKLSPLELAAARLQALQGLIEQEVMFQKAEKEGTVPTDDEVNAEFNKARTESRLSAEAFDAKMKEIGETEASARMAIKKRFAIQKLIDKITGKIEPPKDSEIEQFYNANKDAFKNRRGAQLGAIIIDPRDLGDGDTTKNEIEAQAKVREIGERLLRGETFETVAFESSEDPETRYKHGDWRYFTEEEMKQVFSKEFADFVMNKMQTGQIFPKVIPFEGRYLIIKLQRKQEKDEDRTLESPGVRQEITDYLINARKQLLQASYQAIAMNEARIENNLARRVVENPNELSGARPAATELPATNVNNSANGNANMPINSNAAANSTQASAANKKTANTDSAAANKRPAETPRMKK